MRIKGRVCVPRVDDLINTILIEAHSSRYSIHPGATKMYRDLKQHFWWSRMKRDIMDFIAKCKLSTSKVRTPKARRNTSENAHSGMEMGENRNGFRGWSSNDNG